MTLILKDEHINLRVVQPNKYAFLGSLARRQQGLKPLEMI